MRKSLFVLAFVLILSIGILYAESDYNVGITTNKISQVEKSDQPVSTTVSTNVAITNESQSNAISSTMATCIIDASAQNQINELMTQLQEEEISSEAYTQIKLKIETLNQETVKQSEKCKIQIASSMPTIESVGPVESMPLEVSTAVEGTTTTTVASVSSICYVPYELENKLKDAWNEYYSLFNSSNENGTIDMEKMTIVKETISSAETEINKIKSSCQVSIGTSIATETAPTEKPIPPGQVIASGENCTVPVELTQEFEGLWKNYNEALSGNDTAKADEIKAKISEIESKISSTKGQCVKTLVSERAETRDVISYYKQKVTDVLTQKADTDSQISQLKDLKIEIDKLIVDLIGKKNSLNASDVSGVISEIIIKPNAIEAGTASVSTTTAKVMTQIGNKDIGITPSSTGVVVEEGNLSISSTELSIKNNKVEMAGIEVKILPSSIAGRANVQTTKELNLSVEAGTPIYTIKGDENRNLLLIIPVAMEKQVKVDASTGNVIEEDKPWWSALTSASD